VVAPTTRRRGCGRQLLSAALARATREGARRVILEARESNTAALGLYRGLGFRRDGVRPNYYPARGEQSAENAILMSLQLENKCAGP
jgi:ribosomal-protein-alanine N-acetyltransferase